MAELRQRILTTLLRASGEVITRALRLVPRHAGAYRLRSRLRWQEERKDDAPADLRHALELRPRWAAAHLQLATRLRLPARRKEARAVLARTERLQLTQPDLLLQRAGLRRALGDWAGFRADLRRCIETAGPRSVHTRRAGESLARRKGIRER